MMEKVLKEINRCSYPRLLQDLVSKKREIRRRIRSLSFLLCSIVVLSVTTASAGDSARLLLILDGSGSMWGRIDGQPKITVAKKAAFDTVSALPPEIAPGLMLYGHRRKGDCQDIELVAPPGAPRQQMLDQLKAVTPKGMTPLTASLTKAGQLLAGVEGEATVLLISDGIETCDGDPCAAVAALRNKGLKFVVHVVGFDVKGAAVEQLQCIARAGGGGYFQADDTAGLQQALNAVRTTVVERKPVAPPPPPVQAAATPEEKISTSKRVRIAGPGTVVLDPAPWVSMPPKQWSLIAAESGERRAEGSGAEAKVKEGEYQILWKQSEHGHKEVALTETVMVESGKTIKVALDTGIKLILPQGIQAPEWWGLKADGEKADPAILFRQTLEPQLAPAGNWQLVWKQDQHLPTLELGSVAIESGRLNEIAVDSGLMLQPADWLSTPLYYYALVNAAGQQVGRWTVLGPQLAAPGKYTLVLRPTEHGYQDIAWGVVDIPAHGIVKLPINSGVQFLNAQKAQPPYRIFLTEVRGKREIVVKQTWEPIPVPPGHYRVDWQETEHGSKRSTLVDDLAVEAGTLVEIE